MTPDQKQTLARIKSNQIQIADLMRQNEQLIAALEPRQSRRRSASWEEVWKNMGGKTQKGKKNERKPIPA